ncbi:unnamed protein product [Caenorhabditis sp. 36 PRJEB53466]|nr:unnamed protein product [Caenorhabditis sp. 36 PRJEB53466]
MAPQTVEEIEIANETAIFQNIQASLEKKMNLPVPKKPIAPAEQEEIDARSVYVGNVDWDSTSADLEKLFHGCGAIVRITLPKCRHTGRAKGLAYVEFASVEGQQNALKMSGAEMRDRIVKVEAKRTNKPGMAARGGHFGRGGGGAVRGFHKGHNAVIVKYVYVNGPARGGRGARGKKFAPY